MYIVALTGGIGSGKSIVSDAFLHFNITVIDSDIISRKIVKQNSLAFLEIVNYFGTNIINANGTINRQLLREKIFSFEEKRNWLNNLLHPLIYEETQHQIKKATSPYVLWVVPLLYENKLHKKADRILVIDTKREIQIRRTMIRDHASRKQIERILLTQASREARLSIADDIIINNTDDKYIIFSNVFQLHKKYLSLSALSAGFSYSM